MDVKIGSRWDGMIAEAVASGRYASAEDVVAEGLRRVAEDEGNFAWLKDKLEAALADGGRNSADDARAAIADVTAS
jgi:antitoxin ParD1/3/4